MTDKNEQEYQTLIARVRTIDAEAADYLEGPARNLPSFSFSEGETLDGAFIWEESSQGYPYWNAICRDLDRADARRAPEPRARLQHPPAGIRPLLEASTGHLSDRDREILERAQRFDEKRYLPGAWGQLPRVCAHQYGWCIFLPGDAEGRASTYSALQQVCASAGLLALLAYGFEHGAYILNFDRDAEVVEIPQAEAPAAPYPWGVEEDHY